MQASSVFQAALGVLFLTSWEPGNEKERGARHPEVAPQSPALGEASPSALSSPDVAASAPWTAAAVHLTLLALWACLWGCVGVLCSRGLGDHVASTKSLHDKTEFLLCTGWGRPGPWAWLRG